MRGSHLGRRSPADGVPLQRCARPRNTLTVNPARRRLARGRGGRRRAAARQRAEDLRGGHTHGCLRDHGPQPLHPVGRRHRRGELRSRTAPSAPAVPRAQCPLHHAPRIGPLTEVACTGKLGTCRSLAVPAVQAGTSGDGPCLPQGAGLTVCALCACAQYFPKDRFLNRRKNFCFVTFATQQVRTPSLASLRQGTGLCRRQLSLGRLQLSGGCRSFPGKRALHLHAARSACAG